MKFVLIGRGKHPPSKGIETVYLTVDFWDDYDFKTMFHLSTHDEKGIYHDIDNVKIGYKGQKAGQHTSMKLESVFSSLNNEYFSLGESEYFYKQLGSELSLGFREKILEALRDVVFQQDALEQAEDESVFGISLLRGVSLSSVKGKLRRIINGQAELTDYRFEYRREQEEKVGGIQLPFDVKAESKPSTNIHTIIGRNGVGKTTLLNGMIEAITSPDEGNGRFYDMEPLEETKIDKDYFSSLVSVSFSAFDSFEPPKEQSNPAKGTCYYYVGLKDNSNDDEARSLKNIHLLKKDFIGSLVEIFKESGKRQRWLKAVELLGSDENFAEMRLNELTDVPKETLENEASKLFSMMSSGHSVIILTITRLVALTDEKTLVLIDEPESHLHPPLLSAFVRALSDLLHDRNGVAIIATHSPVVLQEVPSSCVWKITRSRAAVSKVRPKIETFGENVGVLTREVFGLEVVKSGFHSLLEESVLNGGSFDEILNDYDGQLGIEAKGILQAMILDRDRECD